MCSDIFDSLRYVANVDFSNLGFGIRKEKLKSVRPYIDQKDKKWYMELVYELTYYNGDISEIIIPKIDLSFLEGGIPLTSMNAMNDMCNCTFGKSSYIPNDTLYFSGGIELKAKSSGVKVGEKTFNDVISVSVLKKKSMNKEEAEKILSEKMGYEVKIK